MFDWLFQDEDGNLISIDEVISAKIQKLNASKLATEKAVRMIGKAIAKSEIIIQDEHGNMRHDEIYYRLNIQPNDNETGTDFWFHVVCKLLMSGECVICRIEDKYYIADSFTVSESVLRPKRYSNIVLNSAGVQYPIKKTFLADDVIHLRYYNAKLKAFLESLMKEYDDIIDSIHSEMGIANAPKFTLKFGTQITLRSRSTNKVMTQDEYADKVLSGLSSNEPAIIPIGNGIDLDQIQIQSNVNPDELEKMTAMVNKNVAMAFDIPLSVFNGEITEKSDATNEFITYAVSPVVEVINDSLNAKYVGMEDYIKGQRITVWIGNFKHCDLLDSATQMEKLRGIGFSFDEIRNAVGYVALNTDFSTERALTKNFSTDMEKEGEEENADEENDGSLSDAAGENE